MNSVVTMIGQRLLLGLLTLLVVSIVIFGAVALLPGDFAQVILGQSATPEAVAAIRRDLGLDEALISRYLSWLGDALRGDFGRSLVDQRPVAEILSDRLYNTLFLALTAAAISVPLSLTLGALAALYRNSLFDRFVNVFALTSVSSPEFLLGYLLLLVFAVLNPWFPSVSSVTPEMGFGERLYLTRVVTAQMMRMTRASIINLLASPYIEMARLKGMSPARVIVVHALPNALAPIINVVALNLAYLVTGVVVVEVVFVYPGVGQIFVDSVSTRNVPIVQACCLIFAAAYVLLNLAADVMSILSNPRLRRPK